MNREEKTYKQHYACFQCRKVFKKANILETPKERLQFDANGRVVHCPQCGTRMPDVGYDFEAPKNSDVDGWEQAELRIKKSIKYKLSNSAAVKVKNRKIQQKFLERFESNSLKEDFSKGSTKRRRKKQS